MLGSCKRMCEEAHGFFSKPVRDYECLNTPGGQCEPGESMVVCKSEYGSLGGGGRGVEYGQGVEGLSMAQGAEYSLEGQSMAQRGCFRPRVQSMAQGVEYSPEGQCVYDEYGSGDHGEWLVGWLV